jgi:ubiquinone/menaquinone biosynthesis C-methylase UbiE
MDQKQITEFAQQAGISEEVAGKYFEDSEVIEKEQEKILKPLFDALELPAVELGAGMGEFTEELLNKYIKPQGKLYAVERLETAAARLKERLTDPRLEVLQSDSTSLPLPDGSAGLVVSRMALHDFVSGDGDVAKALRDCIRVLAPGGVFLVFDKIIDGFERPEQQSAEGRMERMNVQLAELEGKKCWGLHHMADYVELLKTLGLKNIEARPFTVPDIPGYVTMMLKTLEDRRPVYVKRWGEGVNPILDSLKQDFGRTPPKALPHALVWGRT